MIETTTKKEEAVSVTVEVAHNASPEIVIWTFDVPHSIVYRPVLPIAIDVIIHHCNSDNIHRLLDNVEILFAVGMMMGR